MNFKKLTLTVAMTGALAAGSVQAGVVGQGIVDMTNLLFSQGGTTLDRTDFAAFSFTSTGDVSADLNAASGVATTDSFSGTAFGSDLFVSQGTVTGYVDNTFSPISTMSVSTFAVGDQWESGSPITGLTDTNGDPVSTGANLGNASIVSLLGGDGSAASNNGLEASFTFSGISGVMNIDFDVFAIAQAYLDADSFDISSASGAYSIGFSLIDISTGTEMMVNPIFDANGNFVVALPNQAVNITDTKAAVTPNVDTALTGLIPAATHFTLSTVALDADTSYQLSARISTQADGLVGVPVPAPLALMGLGLIGLGLGRKKVAA